MILSSKPETPAVPPVPPANGKEVQMGGWLKDVKDADKVGLLLLYTGLAITILGTVFTVAVVFYVKAENILDRVLVSVAILTSQGTGLVTAAMGVLRFQSKGNDQPPTSGVQK